MFLAAFKKPSDALLWSLACNEHMLTQVRQGQGGRGGLEGRQGHRRKRGGQGGRAGQGRGDECRASGKQVWAILHRWGGKTGYGH